METFYEIIDGLFQNALELSFVEVEVRMSLFFPVVLLLVDLLALSVGVGMLRNNSFYDND